MHFFFSLRRQRVIWPNALRANELIQLSAQCTRCTARVCVCCSHSICGIKAGLVRVHIVFLPSGASAIQYRINLNTFKWKQLVIERLHRQNNSGAKKKDATRSMRIKIKRNAEARAQCGDNMRPK